MNTNIDIPAVRGALLDGARRDLRRGAARRRNARLAGFAASAVMAMTGVAAATGVIFAAPKVPGDVPVVPEWNYFSHNPLSQDRSEGPALMRMRPEAAARINGEAEKALAAAGTQAKCGTDPGHPLACFLPSGDLVPGDKIGPALNVQQTSADYEVRLLSAAEGHAWLCAHPTQRPGADGGEKPAPAKGYEDC